MVLRSTPRPLSAAAPVTALTVSLAVIALAAASLWGRGMIPGGDREELEKAFRKLRQQAEAASAKVPTFGSDDPPATFVEEVEPVPTPYGNARNMIKVWAELDDGSHAKVSLANYRWKPQEKFHLVVLSSIPVQFALHNCTPDGKVQERVVPSLKHPTRFDGLINPLKQDGYEEPAPFKVPVPLRMFDNTDDEAILLTATVEGKHEDRGPAQVFSPEELDKKAHGDGEAVGTFKEIDAKNVQSDDANDVATILISESAQAQTRLVMHKAK